MYIIYLLKNILKCSCLGNIKTLKFILFNREKHFCFENVMINEVLRYKRTE